MSVFGEVQLGMSRAVSDDEDDEFSLVKEDETLKRKIYWLNGEEKITADQLLLADGASSAAFVYTYLISHFTQSNNMKLVGLSATMSEYKVYQVNHESPEELKKTCSTFRSNYIYLININGKNYIICQLFDQLKHNELYDWIGQLTKKVEFKHALVFCSQDKTQFMGPSLSAVPFVKCLASDKIYDSCARLEPPNFVSHLPAAMIHYCISKQIGFLTFVCYTAFIAADMQSVKEIYSVASNKLKENNIFIDNEYSKKTLLSLNDIVSSATALYV